MTLHKSAFFCSYSIFSARLVLPFDSINATDLIDANKESKFEDLTDKLQISRDGDIVKSDDLKEINLSELEVEPEPIKHKDYSFTDYEPIFSNITENIQSGGVDLTEHFEKVDNEQYKKTIEYLRNYNSEEYKDYLKEYASFFKEQSTKSNLSK